MFTDFKKNHVGWDIRTYDFKSLPSDLKFPKNYDQLSITHQTDWIRLQLLKNGGIWLDVSTITNKPIDTIINMKSNTTQVYPATFGGESVENWLIAAPKNDYLLKNGLNILNTRLKWDLVNIKKQSIQIGLFMIICLI